MPAGVQKSNLLMGTYPYGGNRKVQQWLKQRKFSKRSLLLLNVEELPPASDRTKISLPAFCALASYRWRLVVAAVLSCDQRLGLLFPLVIRALLNTIWGNIMSASEYSSTGAPAVLSCSRALARCKATSSRPSVERLLV